MIHAQTYIKIYAMRYPWIQKSMKRTGQVLSNVIVAWIQWSWVSSRIRGYPTNNHTHRANQPVFNPQFIFTLSSMLAISAIVVV